MPYFAKNKYFKCLILQKQKDKTENIPMIAFGWTINPAKKKRRFFGE